MTTDLGARLTEFIHGAMVASDTPLEGFLDDDRAAAELARELARDVLEFLAPNLREAADALQGRGRAGGLVARLRADADDAINQSVNDWPERTEPFPVEDVRIMLQAFWTLIETVIECVGHLEFLEGERPTNGAGE